MRIAVISETSAGDKNQDVINALEPFGHEVMNIGMREKGVQPELTYIETGLLAGLLLNLGVVDFVIGGCGTGQGFFNSAMQYPNVFCGLIQEPTDAWLFSQINGGNCISLPLNKGYGWAGNVNLEFVFERLFSVEMGCGYPLHRKESQQESRETLKKISVDTHYPMESILDHIDKDILRKALGYPGVKSLLLESKVEQIGFQMKLWHLYENLGI